MRETNLTEREDVRDLVRQRYGEAALAILQGQTGAGCCGSSTSCCGPDDGGGPISSNLYSQSEADEIPEAAILASLGCGNPTALAELKAGETVLDLGSGGGIDVLLSARRVGPTGFAYGLDMTDEMHQLAEQNKAMAGAQNVRFLQGHIEEIPLPDNSVDVIISNCVINLSVDKDQVLKEAFRVLKPGGRFAVSDVVTEGEIPGSIRKDMEAYVGCVAGALDIGDYESKLANAGFTSIDFEPTRRYHFDDLATNTVRKEAVESLSEQQRIGLDGRILSAFIRASKPSR
ncbi:MAG: arsenite methyltransferase [Fimbriimonadaceae bacterium]|nr:arsenite methyltransferase [Fimbriimonadaceae bacterium]